ncbi:hypothetical protein QW71_15920 [Paenibacillus sp. IHB B 3415]|uniref:hypothetical protein n=1 Tax=Paenibacillus sp. IHB B 3415 TaxID=867080 RepID=UPI000574B5FB|nr:hypothetical protein [Paenibacillus sp. IHB B 3415]KHL94807.1 hypothetical protein QW71_15920 [Paenibacillus sp. IHB B 3415]
MLKIGFIVAEHSVKRLKQVQGQLEQVCELTLLPYRSLDEITALYLSRPMTLDAVIFGGELAYLALQKEINGPYPIRMSYLDVTERDFYKLMFQAHSAHPELRSSRMAVDFLDQDNGFLGIKELLQPELLPYMPEEQADRLSYEDMLRFHLELWEQGNIDLSVTRYGNLVDKLTEQGVNAVHLFPSDETILEAFNHMAQEIERLQMKANRTAVGQVQAQGLRKLREQDDPEAVLVMATLHKALLTFSGREELPLIVQKHADYFELLVSQQDMEEKWTGGFASCQLLAFLNDQLSVRVDIGWGAGETLYKARFHGQNALTLAERQPLPSSFAVMEDERIIGPLGESNRLEFTHAHDPQAEAWGRHIGITPLQVQKIIAVMHKLKRDELSSQDIALHLGITLRNANRIMNLLTEKGVATVSYQKQEKLRGRPTKIYKLQFDVLRGS